MAPVTMGKLTTTTIGSFPKPDYVPVRDWFDASRDSPGMNDPTVTTGYSVGDEHEPFFVRAAKEVLDIQVAAGIDIPTDGKVRRENYIHNNCRHLAGFDFDNLETRSSSIRPASCSGDHPIERRSSM